MLRRHFLSLCRSALPAAALPLVPANRFVSKLFDVKDNMTDKTSGYAPVGGLEMYYEIHGEGQPLILLHGGVEASEAFGPNLDALAKTRKVIAVHLQGHGHTRDIDRPLRFESLADDIAGLIAFLKLEKADLLGYSLGGGVALQMAIRHPAQVQRLIVVSTTMRRDGSYPEVLAAFDQMASHAPQIAQNIKQHSPLAQLYPEVNWETLLRRIAELETRDFDWSSAVAKITSPAMLVFADADSIHPKHMVAFYELLGGGKRDAGLDGSLRSAARLAIVPGTTHYNILATGIVTELIIPFLNNKSTERG